MSRNKKFITGATVLFVCICGVAITLVAITFFRPSLLNPLMPVYEYEVVPSTHDGYSRHTLTLDGTTYESDYSEFGLWTNFTDKQIGQTPLGGRIYTIPGQENYVVMYDFMSPIGVFRKSGAPLFDWRTVNYNEMRLYSTEITTATPNEPIISTDIQLIQDAISPFLTGSSFVSQSDVSGISGISGINEGYALYLYGDQLAGMSYALGVYINESGQVYVAENTLSKEWFPASESFSQWAKSP